MIASGYEISGSGLASAKTIGRSAIVRSISGVTTLATESRLRQRPLHGRASPSQLPPDRTHRRTRRRRRLPHRARHLLEKPRESVRDTLIRILCGTLPHNTPIDGVMRNHSAYTMVRLLIVSGEIR